MRAIKIAWCGLTLTGLLLLQGCGGGGGVSKDTSTPTSSTASSSSSSVASVSSASSVSSSVASVSAAETHLGTDNLPPDSGVAAAATLAAEYLSPENAQASALASEDLAPL